LVFCHYSAFDSETKGVSWLVKICDKFVDQSIRTNTETHPSHEQCSSSN
jgi:hypothetical protein